MTTKTTKTTGYYVPVLRDDEPPEYPPNDAPMDAESSFNLWTLVFAVATITVLLSYGSGWLKPPQKATLDELSKTQQKLDATNAELNRIKSCVSEAR